MHRGIELSDMNENAFIHDLLYLAINGSSLIAKLVHVYTFRYLGFWSFRKLQLKLIKKTKEE